MKFDFSGEICSELSEMVSFPKTKKDSMIENES